MNRHRAYAQVGPNPPSSEPVSVLFVGGEGRSGSTILATALAARFELVAVGELHGLWQAMKTNELCSCGRAFYDCPFWSAVGLEAYGGWQNVRLPSVLQWNTSLTRHRNFYRVVSSWSAPRYRREVAEYAEQLSALYRAIASVSGCRSIVDSSKDPPYAFLLRRLKSVDLRIIHLVRDSRGVAHSWGKATVERPEYRFHPTLAGTFMNTRGPARSAVEWCVKNGLFEVLGWLGTPRALVRYEILVSDPPAMIDAVAQRLGVLPAGQAIPSEVPNAGDAGRWMDWRDRIHMLGGNRVRFSQELPPMRIDEDWRRLMSLRHRATVGAISFPFLVRYGYVKRLHWAAVREVGAVPAAPPAS